ncbi:MAG: 7-cyano-7-deazaguanine synthase QueC [Elusimicrobiota bacterium]|jgi:7-cyano-7-deazaguanine synthase|nr:7-cyano-7-deazaguanine synthase QueC [Elusimicrobiota bacterium]
MGKDRKVIVLLSGGLDSAVCLYWALDKGYKCAALNISYGQRHEKETFYAHALCKKRKVKLTKIKINLPWLEGATSLVGKNAVIPDEPLKKIKSAGRIPSTYVPARNLIFMSLAASMADSTGAQKIIAGPNAIDFSGYPDCRPQFYKPLEKVFKEGTRAGACGKEIKIITPLIKMSKTQIVRLAVKLGVPFNMTWSCYSGGKKPCGKCDACKLRAEGFKKAGIKDICR